MPLSSFCIATMVVNVSCSFIRGIRQLFFKVVGVVFSMQLSLCAVQTYSIEDNCEIYAKYADAAIMMLAIERLLIIIVDAFLCGE